MTKYILKGIILLKNFLK